MKKYSHAWLAFMAIKRLEIIASAENESVVKGINEEIIKNAKTLVKWFKDYRDFVIEGAWYPDDVFKDMSTSHIVKFEPDENGAYDSFRNMPSTHSIAALMKKKSPFYKQKYNIVKGNCADRCESERGCPITTTGNHIAMRFFILSHYVADCHMPLHCDNRAFSDEKGIHGAIEKKWEDQVKKSYKIDTDNNRFFYNPEGYPLPLKPTPLMQAVEDEIGTSHYIHTWGTGNSSTWDYMSGVSQYSYLFSNYLIPRTFSNTQGMDEFMEQTEWGQHFDDYNKMIFSDAIDSIARIWLHVWMKYTGWLK